MSEVTMKRRRLDGYSPEDKARIKSIAVKLVSAQIAEEVVRRNKGNMPPLSDPQFEAMLQELMPNAVETAVATINAVNEYLS